LCRLEKGKLAFLATPFGSRSITSSKHAELRCRRRFVHNIVRRFWIGTRFDSTVLDRRWPLAWPAKRVASGIRLPCFDLRCEFRAGSSICDIQFRSMTQRRHRHPIQLRAGIGGAEYIRDPANRRRFVAASRPPAASVWKRLQSRSGPSVRQIRRGRLAARSGCGTGSTFEGISYQRGRKLPQEIQKFLISEIMDTREEGQSSWLKNSLIRPSGTHSRTDTFGVGLTACVRAEQNPLGQ